MTEKINYKQLKLFVEQLLHLREKVKCPICLDVFKKPTKVSCQHIFCEDCLELHVNVKETAIAASSLCPVCRRPFKRRQLHQAGVFVELAEFVRRCSERVCQLLGCSAINTIDWAKYKKSTNLLLKNKHHLGELPANTQISYFPGDEFINKLLFGTNSPRNTIATTKNTKLKYSVKQFRDSHKKMDIQNWLTDNKNHFDRITQTQQSQAVASETQNTFDMPSVSQQNQKRKLGRSRKRRARSLDIQIKRVRSKSRIRRLSLPCSGSEAGDVVIEQIDSENVNEDVLDDHAKKVALLKVLEDQFLDSMESESGSVQDEAVKRKCGENDNGIDKDRHDETVDSSKWRSLKMERKVLHEKCKPKMLKILKRTKDGRFKAVKVVKDKPVLSKTVDEGNILNFKKVPIVLLEKLNMDQINKDIVGVKVTENETRSFDLNVLEAYFVQNFLKVNAEQSDSTRTKAVIHQNKDVELLMGDEGNANQLNELPRCVSKSPEKESDDEIFLLPTQPFTIPQNASTPEQNNLPKTTEDLLNNFEITLKRYITTKVNHKQDLSKVLKLTAEIKLVLKNLVEGPHSNCDNEMEIDLNSNHSDASTQTVVGGSKNIGLQVSPEQINAIVQTDSCLKLDKATNYDTVAAQTRSTAIQVDEVRIECPVQSPMEVVESATGANKLTSLVAKYTPAFSNSFDDVQFDTDELINNRLFRGTIVRKRSNLCLSPQEVVEHPVQTFANDNPQVISSTSTSKINKSHTKQSNSSGNVKRFKRIRTLTSDSESDSDVNPKKKSNKFLRDDLSVNFVSEPPKDLVVEEKDDTFPLSEGSDNINYNEFLDMVMAKYDDKQKNNPAQRPETNAKTSQNLNRDEVPANTSKKSSSTSHIHGLSLKSNCDLSPAALEEFNRDFSANDVVEMREGGKNTVETFNEIQPENGDDDIFNDHGVMDVIERDIAKNAKKGNCWSESIFGQSDYVGRNNSHSYANKEIPMEERVSTAESIFSDDVRKSSSETLRHNMSQGNETVKGDLNVNVIIKDSAKRLPADSHTNNFKIDNNIKKINILQNVVVPKPSNKDCLDTDDEILSDADIVESTPPRKQPISITDIKKLETLKQNLSDAATNTDLLLPPPPGFGDSGDMNAINEDCNENTEVATIINNSSTTPDNLYSNTIREKRTIMETSTPRSCRWVDSEKLVGISPIPAENKRISVLESARDARSSPLTLIHKTPKRKTSFITAPKHQQTILHYIRTSQDAKNDTSFTKPEPKAKACITCSRLSKDQVIAISSMTNRKLAAYSNTFSSNVTHVVVTVNEKNCVKDHTIKFVSAVAAGIWVVNFRWIQECLSQNRLVHEEPYEVLDVSGIPGPRNSRLTRRQRPLLKGFKIYAAPPFISTTQADVENVINMLGGKIVSRPDDLVPKNGYVCVIITEARATEEFETYESWLEALKVVTVDIEWLSRSVGQYQLLSLRPFALCSDESIGSLGYPEELAIDLPFSFSQSTYSAPSST